jgi:RNA polymerase sigma factor (sigma-70 family)
MMAKFRIDSLGELARQMAFTPVEVRQTQVAAAEELLHTVEPLKAYPVDFVLYRITGYRRKTVSADMLAGSALQHDLGLLIELVTDTLDLTVATMAEPVLSIDDVTEKFNVASKTIQRWRRRGLPARRFVFPDGKRRIGFLLSSVERFIAANGQQVASTANVSQVSGLELNKIVRRARALVERGCGVDEITRRIGRKMNRSPLTVLHTVKKWEAEHPGDPVFAHARRPLDEADRARILRGRKHGKTIGALARRHGRPTSTIYHVLLDDRLARLSRHKSRFIDDPLYHQSDALAVINAIVKQDDALPAAQATTSDRPAADLPPYLQAIYRTPLLSPQRERALFLKFNYHKYRFAARRRRLDPQLARVRDLKILESQLAQATEVKNEIIRANLRLVVSVARKHARSGIGLMELVSEGNLTLLRAVEAFDIHRGFKFSTYATLSVMKGFARSIPLMQAASRGAGMGESDLANLPDSRFAAATDRITARDEIAQLLRRLSPREKQILLARYGLENRPATETFEQVATTLGLTTQRIRQIEAIALAKLRSQSNS